MFALCVPAVADEMPDGECLGDPKILLLLKLLAFCLVEADYFDASDDFESSMACRMMMASRSLTLSPFEVV